MNSILKIQKHARNERAPLSLQKSASNDGEKYLSFVRVSANLRLSSMSSLPAFFLHEHLMRAMMCCCR
jgi:hypothetical protein